MAKKTNRLKVFSAFIFWVIFFSLFYLVGFKTFSKYLFIAEKEVKKPQENIIKAQEVKRYFVAVAHPYNSLNDISLDELAGLAMEGNLKVGEENKRDLSIILGKEITPSADLSIGHQDIGIIEANNLLPSYKLLMVNGKSIFEDNDYPLFIMANKRPLEVAFNKDEVVKITSVGDIILSRGVYQKMLTLGYKSPFEGVAKKLESADITFGNLENSISDNFTPPTTGMNFLAPTAALEGVILSGFDILGLANNHSTNFGLNAFKDTLAALEKNNITFVGGGMTEKEAKNYQIIKTKGKSFAFLAVNSIIGDIPAKESSPGTWKISLEPWGNINQKQVDEVVSVIKKAKSEADFVIVMPHWGAEYKLYPNSEMMDLAKQMVGAGADLIVGTHPHWVQGMEIYNNKLITYSLGNFIFDQEWSKETKQGLILDTYFYKDKIISFSFTPVLIENYHKPRILDPLFGEGKIIMDRVWQSSKWINKDF
jgi:poly-gamma-glutamate capsule biosynthesis protein CapA/YwtB (metallophosphatase superfamily)